MRILRLRNDHAKQKKSTESRNLEGYTRITVR